MNSQIIHTLALAAMLSITVPTYGQHRPTALQDFTKAYMDELGAFEDLFNLCRSWAGDPPDRCVKSCRCITDFENRCPPLPDSETKESISQKITQINRSTECLRGYAKDFETTREAHSDAFFTAAGQCDQMEGDSQKRCRNILKSCFTPWPITLEEIKEGIKCFLDVSRAFQK
jgi:hypothetical protein